MTPEENIAFLHKTGHFWSPANPNTANVGSEHIRLLDLDHRHVKDAVASWQAKDANFEFISQLPPEHGGHNRSVIPDGDIGPVTRAMFQMPRCPIPDWAPPVDDTLLPIYSPNPEVQRDMEGIVRSMRANATGSGSWPIPGCDVERPDRENEHSVRVNINTSKASSHQKQVMADALRMVEACEAEIGQAVRHILDGDPAEAEHDIRFEYIPGGVIGYNYFPTPGTCNQVVKGRIDNSYNQSALAIATLMVHEYKGHGDGLQHTRGGIMNPSLLRVNPLSWRGDPHERTKQRYFGGEPIDNDPPPPPDPPDPPGPDPPTGPQIVRIEIRSGTLELDVRTVQSVLPSVYPSQRGYE